MSSFSSPRKIATVLGLSVLASSCLGALSAMLPMPVIVGALFGLFAVMGWLLYLNIDGPKGLKVVLALISLLLNITGMWYSWTWVVSDLATANYLLTGGFEAVLAISNAAISGGVSVRGIDLGENYLLYTAIASTLAVAFPPVIWGLMSNSSRPDAE